MEITCTVTCLDTVDTRRYSPGLFLVITELGKSVEILANNVPSNEESYRDIEYQRLSLCSETNNYTMQYSYYIYPTINMDQTVVRCGVYYSTQRPCQGDPAVVIWYNSITPTSSTSIPYTSTPMTPITPGPTVGEYRNIINQRNIFAAFFAFVATIAVAVVIFSMVFGCKRHNNKDVSIAPSRRSSGDEVAREQT